MKQRICSTLVGLLVAGGAHLDSVSAQKPPLSDFQCSSGSCENGFGAQQHKAGFQYEGEFVNGVRTGLGVETMPGGVRYAGHFENNLPNGFGAMIFPDGRFFAGEWKDEFPHGCGLSVEMSRPDESVDLQMELRHQGRWEHGEIVDPEADCHEDINKGHEAAKAAVAAGSGKPYVYTPAEPRAALSKEEELDLLNQMQRNVLHLISIVSNKASDGKMDEVEELTETLHGVEVTFVKMYYSKRKTIGADFKPLFSRDALETVIFETMLEIDESTVADTTEIESQLAMMEEDLENFPSDDEQNLRLLQTHLRYTEQALAEHKAQGDEKAATEAENSVQQLRKQIEDMKQGLTPQQE